jgi:hypothetical protein
VAADALIPDVHAIGAVEVLDYAEEFVADDLAMMAAYGSIIDLQVGIRRAANHHPSGAQSVLNEQLSTTHDPQAGDARSRHVLGQRRGAGGSGRGFDDRRRRGLRSRRRVLDGGALGEWRQLALQRLVAIKVLAAAVAIALKASYKYLSYYPTRLPAAVKAHLIVLPHLRWRMCVQQRMNLHYVLARSAIGMGEDQLAPAMLDR